MRLTRTLSGRRQWMLKLLPWSLIILGPPLLDLKIRKLLDASGCTKWNISQMGLLRGTKPGWLLRDLLNMKVLTSLKLFPLWQRWILSRHYLLFLLWEVGTWLSLMWIMLFFMVSFLKMSICSFLKAFTARRSWSASLTSLYMDLSKLQGSGTLSFQPPFWSVNFDSLD